MFHLRNEPYLWNLGLGFNFKKRKQNRKMEMPKMRWKKERKCKFIKEFAEG